jgi:hypothetical protein
VKNSDLSPLLMQTTIGPFASIGAGGSAAPLSIYNPNKTAMLIDQLRFSFRDPNASTGLSSADLCYLQVEVLLGSIPLTKQFVTLGALAPRYAGASAEDINALGPGGDAGLTWHLPKPLYVPPLVQVTVNVRRQPIIPNDTGIGTVSVLNVTVVGRSLPTHFPIPGEIEIPWVTETQCNTAATRFVSGDGDLVNSNEVPLNITQFVGVNYNGAQSGPSPADLTVQMSLSNGMMLVRDPIPFFLAFPSDRGILPVSARLQPGAFVRLELESAVPPGGESYDGCGFTAVAMHGYRSIQTPGTLG